MSALSTAGHRDDEMIGVGGRRPWHAMSRESFELLFYAVLPPTDILAISVAFLAAFGLRASAGLQPVSDPVGADSLAPTMLIVIPLWILIFALAGLYSQSALHGRWDEIGKTFMAVSAGTMVLVVADSAGGQSLFPTKEVPIYGYLLSFVFVLAGRQTVRTVQQALFARDLGVHRAVIIGSGAIAQAIAQSLNRTRRTGYKVVGVIDSNVSGGQRISDVPVFTGLEDMASVLGRRLDEFIEADSSLQQDDILAIMKFAADHQLGYRFVPHQRGPIATHMVMDSLAGLPVVRIRQTPLEGWGRIIKRIFDVVGAGIGIVLLSPLFGVVALLIKCLDPGPVIFMQLRLSRAGEPFFIYKFRTMMTKYSGRPPLEVFRELGREDLVEEFEIDQKVKDDPRVSRLGAFLRKSSIDELPQLWNVLLGHLSLVGPRPIVEEELPKFGDAQATILTLKPGITGAWQISGRNDLSYEERVRLNIEYVQNWSLLLDVRILLKTLLILMKGRGAY
jgi:exopolysaccharide biosynthesis polyprenyl glycosylphosphotransferase